MDISNNSSQEDDNLDIYTKVNDFDYPNINT